EHSHEQFLTTVRASLNVNNPLGIKDVVFGLLGNAAASAGQGQVTDTDCLQQATADQAFTNAKAANDVAGMTAALIYRALERNTGAVGQASVLWSSTFLTNPSAAITQHQDPASANAAATNKQIVLELAKQIASIGGNPQDAIKSGTFAPGVIGDPTGAGKTCDVANDPTGCIFTQNLLVPDATPDEIDAAVSAAGLSNVASNSTSTASNLVSDASDLLTKLNDGTLQKDQSYADAWLAGVSTNVNTFTGALNGAQPVPVTFVGGERAFQVNGDTFVNKSAAIQRACSVQNNACADAFNSKKGTSSVADCNAQEQKCEAQSA
ncbi:hypothetical protein TREMEDRAFT_29844, partial [Tremella mesenterica DSM 1558]|uniref:uncharacterized protein n=1 Tax=Tremella mesenterica (strain ATCC 24925 / CBS 8224 / DSM 1558 / NBRC 9311 / NRRL Y-6157 / RJB 2259-6 / UBC 559-6) TaxID=578456 RepID=UPI0003F4A2E7